MRRGWREGRGPFTCRLPVSVRLTGVMTPVTRTETWEGLLVPALARIGLVKRSEAACVWIADLGFGENRAATT